MGQPNIATETQSGNHSIGARRPARCAARPSANALRTSALPPAPPRRPFFSLGAFTTT